VLGRRQRGDVADALVVGLAGAFAHRQAAVVQAAAGGGLRAHLFLSSITVLKRKNRRGCRRFVWVRGALFLGALVLPAAGEGQKPKARKEISGATHGAQM